ncbi:MAG: saccharopine dehydrogenase [Gammaproteobacteria bacterium]|nr:saccharopine dehydrogenase [Gammaproteobacteria bacterium]
MTHAIAVLGAGMVGRAIVADLCPEFDVTAVDADAERLALLERHYAVPAHQADLSQPAIVSEIAGQADLVVCAVPGFLGYDALAAVIASGTNVVDISFFNDDPFKLDELAKTNSVIAITDCGVAPGMPNMIAGYHDANMQVDRFEYVVGGLPVERKWPYEYKAPFSPIDVMEEYVRPARLRENGKIVTRPALSDAELLDIEPVGQLEAFNTDGLRTLLQTTAIPEMRERTLRYPGHIELMRVLRESGFFSTTPVVVKGQSIAPRDLTAALLFPLWQPEPGERAFTVMVIDVEGTAEGNNVSYRYHLYDEDDAATGLSSMARTTGFTATAAARLVLQGHYTRTGISPPEYLGAAPGCLDRILAMLAERNVIYRRS